MSEEQCRKCIMPDTKPGISFDATGVCNACLNARKNDQTNWALQQKKLRHLIGEIYGTHRANGKYHCVIPVSGGKDSTFLAMTARELELTPLCVNVRPCRPTERGERNIENLSKLGFDIIRFYPNQRIMPKLMKKSFCEDGDPCTTHEFMLYSVPVKEAMVRKIPLIIWAEDPQFEYGNPGDVKNADEQKNIGGLWGRDADHWLCEGVTKQDLISFQHPTAEEIRTAGVKAIYLGNYIHWDSRKIATFAISYGLEQRPQSELLGTGGYWDFEQLDDETPAIGHYLKFLKFGYGRATDQACRDIRLGYITREQGLEMAKRYDGHLHPDYVERFCKYIHITIKEFHKIANSFYRNPVKI